MKKRILVTGGAGFIGTNLCTELLQHNNEIICVDNFYSGNKNNLITLLDNPYFEMIRHDVTFPLYLEIDEIYNLACPASPIFYQKDPVQTTKSSIHGAINMLGLAKRLKIKILQASTSEVYGDPEVNPQKEEYWGRVNPIGIRSCYDESKRCAETLFFDYNRQNKVKIKVVRIFNTYGPYMQINDGRVVSNFIVQALTNKNITIYGNGTQSRSFCYIDDLVNGLIAMMSTGDIVTGPINLGNPHEISIKDLASKIVELTNSKSTIIFKDLPSDDPKIRCPNIGKAKSILNWQPTVSLEDGLKKTINYFDDLLNTQLKVL